MSDFLFDTFLGFCCMVILGIGMLFGVIVGGVAIYNFSINKPACSTYSTMTGEKSFWTLGEGCTVFHEGGWVDISVATQKKQEITVRQK
jgi:hypothetical protein